MHYKKLFSLSLIIFLTIIFIQNISFARAESAVDTQQNELITSKLKKRLKLKVEELNKKLADPLPIDIEKMFEAKCCNAYYEDPINYSDITSYCGFEIDEPLSITETMFLVYLEVSCLDYDDEENSITNVDATQAEAHLNAENANQVESQAEEDDDDELKKKYMYGDDNYWN